jgi:hypothetical protein
MSFWRSTALELFPNAIRWRENGAEMARGPSPRAPAAQGGGLMRLVPRSPRGTWLFATALWLGLCAAAWEILPALPAVEWRDLPAGYYVADVLPAGPSIVMVGGEMCALAGSTGPVVVLDTGTGRRRDVLKHFGPNLRMSPDGRWAEMRDAEGVRLRDTDSMKVISLQVSDPKSAVAGEPTFSIDAALFAYCDRIDDLPVVRIFDVRAGRPVGIVRDGVPPLAFDPAGRRLVCGAEVGQAYECRVVDWPAGTVLWHLPLYPWGRFEFSSTGDRLFRLGQDERSQSRVCCVDLATGQPVWEIPVAGNSCLPGDKSRVFTTDHASGAAAPTVEVRAARDGELLGCLTFAAGETLSDGSYWASPAGPVVAVQSADPLDRIGEWLRRWVPWLGVEPAPGRIRLVDLVTGRTTCVVPGGGGQAFFLPDGRLATFPRGVVQVWDIPPRKPLSWFAVAAGVLALPPAWLARRRIRRLRQQAA